MFGESFADFVEEVMPFAVLLHSIFSVAVFSQAPALARPGAAGAGGPNPCIAMPIVGLVINIVLLVFFELWELCKKEDVEQVRDCGLRLCMGVCAVVAVHVSGLVSV